MIGLANIGSFLLTQAVQYLSSSSASGTADQAQQGADGSFRSAESAPATISDAARAKLAAELQSAGATLPDGLPTEIRHLTQANLAYLQQYMAVGR